ncbi:MAG TPA: FlgD immunoglobulin-like domain containing protein [Candidatus Eisenbacteria bacterium]|nr:FlgD immunoglobulin-like domain containing protein [Candidatus Eisenbacteria bacterium]
MKPAPVLFGMALLALACASGTPVRDAMAEDAAFVSGLVIHGAEETLRDFCVQEDGALWLVLPDGARHELVTSTKDPVIANPGDGSFHAFDEREVRAALAALRHPLGTVRAEVFLLPYPRRAGLESAAAPQLILLSPGTRPLSVEHQHAEFVHELGHVVQYARMPESEIGQWEHYRELRGITDASVYNASAAHAYRPREIFAEDFRALFGGARANYSGTVENAALAPPATVAGLEDFMRSVAAEEGVVIEMALHCFPNPSSGTVIFARPGSTAAALDVFDASGRRVATMSPSTTTGSVTWRWDGRDLQGHSVGAGMFFARTRTGGPSLRVSRVR